MLAMRFVVRRNERRVRVDYDFSVRFRYRSDPSVRIRAFLFSFSSSFHHHFILISLTKPLQDREFFPVNFPTFFSGGAVVVLRRVNCKNYPPRQKGGPFRPPLLRNSPYRDEHDYHVPFLPIPAREVRCLHRGRRARRLRRGDQGGATGTPYRLRRKAGGVGRNLFECRLHPVEVVVYGAPQINISSTPDFTYNYLVHSRSGRGGFIVNMTTAGKGGRGRDGARRGLKRSRAGYIKSGPEHLSGICRAHGVARVASVSRGQARFREERNHGRRGNPTGHPSHDEAEGQSD